MEEKARSTGTSKLLAAGSGKTKSNTINIPSLSLPKGGGALRGIDSKFTVNAVNATASFSVPLPFSEGRGFSPKLNLTYNSGSGNGIFGLGWSLDLISIKRKTEKTLPRYLDSIDSDVFMISGVEDLVPAFRKELDGTFSLDAHGDYIIDEKNSGDGLYTIRRYIPRIESAFSLIERWTDKNTSRIKWRVVSQANLTTLYGWTENSCIADPENDLRIYEWLPEFTFDDKGNCAHYVYQTEDIVGLDESLAHNQHRLKDSNLSYTNLYLSKVLYGNKTPYKKLGDVYPLETDYLFQTVFDYGSLEITDSPDTINVWDYRADAFSSYKSGFEIRTTRLCKRVLLFHFFSELVEGSALIKSANFTYSENLEGFTFLKAVRGLGYIKKEDSTYTSLAMPDTEFTYKAHEWNKELKELHEEALVNLPSGLSEANYQFTDLYNEGIAGILTEKNSAWYYKQNLGGANFSPARCVLSKPSFHGLGSDLQLSDLEANGLKQLVSFNSELKGYFEVSDDEDWQNFVSFKKIPNINLNSDNMRFIDLNGDGKADVLMIEDEVFTWYESAGKEGFSDRHVVYQSGEEDLKPRLLFNDSKQSIFLADMSGDGLIDIVKITNSAVVYWPNLGYGRFGAKVTMDSSPVFDDEHSFNPNFIRLADIDASGTTDIIYLAENKFSCWMNLNGNSFKKEPFTIEAFPELHAFTKVSAVDLLGTGLSCIVWSSPLLKDAHRPLRYIDLMNSKKPHIMTSYKNNLGKEVNLEYTASTKFYLEDKLFGKEWATKLHFPVYCVSKVETIDAVTGHRFTSSYKYHHGYYDHDEAEFRGFALVEQTDTEHFAHWVKSAASNIVDAELHQEPVITKSWFHTGAFQAKEKISNFLTETYWQQEMLRAGFSITNHEKDLEEIRIVMSPGLGDSYIDKLSPDEYREAYRACKSNNLRKELFAHDAPELAASLEQIKKQLSPFSVNVSNYFVELLQPKGKNKHAVFIVKENESLVYNYDREIDDPRIAHTLNIKVDEYANILESASIVYPRLINDTSLPALVQLAQNQSVIGYVEKCFTNDVFNADTYLLRMASEVKTYELTGLSKLGFYYQIEDFKDILDTAVEIPYHLKNSPAASPVKRITEHVRTLYYSNNLRDPLALHRLESLALPYENYQLAYTPDLLNNIFSAKANPAELNNLMLEAKYTHTLDENAIPDTNWWVRSGISEYISSSETPLIAANRFYLPIAYRDPYGARNKVKYYADYHLFIEETEDALANKNTVERFNFRTLAPERLRDVNNNISETISNELGLVKAMALFGKADEADDLEGITEYQTDAEKLLLDEFLNTDDSQILTANAKALLKHATSYFVYDLQNYKLRKKPVLVASISREEHFRDNANSAVQIAFDYSNASGKVVLKKVQAEPGLAKKVTLNSDNTYSLTEINTAEFNPKKLRWLGNGKTVINNKGNPVKQYEPFFSVTHRYEDFKELVETGFSPINYYDVSGRLVKTMMPNGSFTETIFSAWKEIKYDLNDTILRSDWYTDRSNRLIDTKLISEAKDPAREKLAADKAARHAETPTVDHFDSHSRTVLSLSHNKNLLTNADEFYETYTERDIEGNLLKVIDARGNTVISYKYDILGNNVYHDSMDAGKHWRMANIMGSPLRTWDERNHVFEYSYDILHRPTLTRVRGGDAASPLNNIFERIVYGELETNPELKNLRGKVIRHYDTAGLQETLEYDFAGQPKSTTRKLFSKYKELSNWTDANLISDLDTTEFFTFSTETDALGRMRRQITPNGDIITATYGEGTLLKTQSIKHLDPDLETVYVSDIDYNERGVHNRVVYGNGVVTEFFYDKENYRLNRLRSKRANGDPLQDWFYTYDPVGNITHIENKNTPTVFFNNEKINSLASYNYDALYRLTEASARENNRALTYSNSDNWHDSDFSLELNYGDPLAMRNFTQSYSYDSVGNILEMRHQAALNNWTRNYNYAANSNRLLSTVVGQGLNSFTYNYTHHAAHGYMTAISNLDEIGWNFKEEVVKTIRQRRYDGGTPETTYYQYDKDGKRIRKITENQANPTEIPTKKDERIYIAGYELYRKHSGTHSNLRRVSLSLIDKGKRFALIETRNNIDDNTEKHLVRYQLHNHIGSASLEIDINAEVISYEEYHPFGTTAYQAKNASIKSAAKRYRYTGMERDEETGLSYHDARYYMPWLGRWLSADPIGIGDGVNLYAYAGNRPITSSDPSGEIEWPSVGTVALVVAVVAVAVVVTVATAGVGTAALGAAVGAAGLSGGAATAATAVGSVVVAGAAGAAGSVAATATVTGITERRLPTRSEVRDAAVSGAVAGVVTAGVGAALSAGARGTVAAARAATTAGNASTAARAVTAVSAASRSSGAVGVATRTATRVATGAAAGSLGGATHEATRQVVSGEASRRGGLDMDRVGSAASSGAAGGAVLNSTLGPAISRLGVRAYEGGYTRGISIRSLPVRGRGLSWLSSQTGNPYLIGEHGTVAGRRIVTVATPEGPRAFYARTGGGGSNSGGSQPGDWSPFEGFSNMDGSLPRDLGVPRGWFVKDRFAAGLSESDPLYRFGTPENLATSRWLGTQRLGTLPRRADVEVQQDLISAGVPVRDPYAPYYPGR